MVYMAKASCLREFSTDQHVPGVRRKDKLILGFSTIWQKNSTWQQGTAEHLPLGEDQGVSIRTVHRNWVSCTTHCPVFPWKHVPGQQLLCQPGFLPSAKCKRVGLTAAGKAETTLSNQPHASPQGFREWMQLGQAPVHTFWMASK